MPVRVGVTPIGFWFALGAAGVLLLGGLLLVRRLRRENRSLGANLHLLEESLAAAQRELEEHADLELEMEREIARLKRIPKADLLPMLKLAHELRSPLAAVSSSLEIILQGYAENNPQLRNEMLTLAQNRAGALLDRVNDFLRLGAVKYVELERKPRAVDILSILEQLAPELQVRARWVAVNLEFNLPAALPLVLASAEDMEHLLSNLINNAIKYTDPGGLVTVTLFEDGPTVVGTVKDNGIGIAPEELPRVFEEFYRTESAKSKAPGTGLGLSIAKRVVDLYDGQISVESQVGKGSKFTFSFPVSGAQRTPS